MTMKEFLEKNGLSLSLAALTIGLLIYPRLPKPSPQNEKQLTRDVREALRTAGSSEGKTAAIRLSGMCTAFAAQMNLKDEAGAPAYRTGKQLDNLRRAISEATTGGNPITKQVPALSSVLNAHFQSLGTSPGPKTDEDRKRWHDAHLELAHAAAEAWQGL